MKKTNIWDRLVFGKNYSKAKTEKRFYIARQSAYFNFIACAIIFLGFLIVFYLFFDAFWGFKYETKFDLSDLNETQREKAFLILAEIKEEYLFTSKSIRITNNITKYMSKKDIKDDVKDVMITKGFNQKDNIIVEYVDDEDSLKEYICHEILHSFTKKSKLVHELIYDMGRKKVCFEEYKRMELILDGN